MEFKFCEEEFYEDFVDLAVYVECEEHYDAGNEQHVNWLRKRIQSVYLMGGLGKELIGRLYFYRKLRELGIFRISLWFSL